MGYYIFLCYDVLCQGNYEHNPAELKRNYYMFEHRCNVMEANVTKRNKKRPFKSYTEFALTNNEYMRLMLACSTTAETCLIGLAVELGLRREDVVGLEINNIDFDNKRIVFLERKKNRLRTMPLPDVQLQDIRKHLNTLRKGERFLFPAARKDSKTGHMSGMEAWRTLQYLCLVADIPAPPGRKGRPFHSLRGTCYKLRQNRDKWTVEQAAAWLGDTAAVAMTHYGKTTDAELETLIRRSPA